MAEERTLLQGTRLRATRIDGCGRPVAGAASTVVSKGFVSVSIKDNVESGEEFKVKLADGSYCINQRSKPNINWAEVGINMCQVAPELYEMLTGSPLVYDDSVPPKPVGFGRDGSTYATASFALELWTNIGRGNAEACTGVAVRYGYMLLPWVIEGSIGDLTVENGPISFTINGISSTGNDWGVGPYDVVIDRFGNPSPLFDEIPHDRHFHVQFTDMAPPALVAGYQHLVLAS